MRNRDPLITYAYHFISEALILFLILVPFLYYQYQSIPYWSYLFSTVIICFAFTMIAKISNLIFWYVITTPFLFGLFYFLHYPLVISILLALVLTWRYIYIRAEKMRDQEKSYLMLIIILSILLIIFIQDKEIIGFTLIQLLLLIFGFIFSHIKVIGKKQQKQINHTFFPLIAGLFMLSGLTLFFLFTPARLLLRKIWQGITYILLFVISKIASLFSVLGIQISSKTVEQEAIEMDVSEGDKWEEFGPSAVENLAPYINGALLVILIGFVLFMVARIYRRKFKNIKQINNEIEVTYTPLDRGVKQTERFNERLLSSFFKKSGHPVRRLIYQFEKKAAKTEYGRYSYETIEEWLKRIGVNLNLTIYQKVRYGEKEISETEMNALKSDIKKITAELGI